MRFCALILLGLFGFLSAQDDVYWEPNSPIEGEQVNIYYHLENRNVLPASTNPVYLHLGYDGWNNTDDYTMTKNFNGYWEYTLDIPENASTIDFAFTDRISDYNGTWDNNGGYGVDWHVNVYSEGLSIVVVTPTVENPYNNIFRTPVIVEQDSILQITYTTVSTGAPFDSLFFNINGLPIHNTTLDTLNYYFDPSGWATDRFTIDCIGKDVNGLTDTTTFAVVVRPEQQSLQPPSYIKPGIHYHGIGWFSLALYAPEKDFVYIIGSSLYDWEVSNHFLMNKYEPSSDSTLFWFEFQIYDDEYFSPFQYLVDGEIRIADPYSELILDPWNDEHIQSDIYPNLPEYPEGKTSYPVSVYYPYSTNYNYEWKYNDYTKPNYEELVIYELLIRDFIEQHDYTTLIDTLDYLENLGVNAIELMPINEFEGNSSWGYNPSFYFAHDKYYGPKDDLKAFVDECHRRGIAVIQDIVLQHSYGQSPLVRLYWDDENNRPASNNPWYNKKSPNPVFSWGYDFNHESEDTKYFVDRVLKYWIQEYKIDGFRLDFTKGFTNTGGDGSAYDYARIAILKRIANEVWNYAPSTYLILEHLAENAEEKELANHGLLLWGNSNFNYTQASMGYSSSSDFSWGYYKNRGWTEPNLVTYMESHDEERMMYKNLQYGNSSGSYNIKDLATALDRQKLASAFFFTLPGPKMIWQFGELGYDYSIDYNGRIGEKPIRWEYFNDADRKELYNTYSKLINLRNKNKVFTSPTTSVDMSVSGDLKRIRLSHPSQSVVIIGNFGVTTQSIDPGFFYSATWYDDLNSDSLVVTNTNELIELQPGKYRIYTTKHLLDIEESEEVAGIPIQFSLEQNFPNPFNPITTIKYSIPTESFVQISIYNISGQEVARLVDDIQPIGKYNLEWNASDLTSGIYFYQLTTDNFTESKKMLLIK